MFIKRGDGKILSVVEPEKDLKEKIEKTSTNEDLDNKNLKKEKNN